MTKIVPEKARAAMMSIVRRTAMMGAAATALVALAPSSYAGVRVGRGSSVQTAVKNTLSLSRDAAKRDALAALSANKITIDNGIDITVDAAAAAISRAEIEEDIEVVNSGDLTGGIGIDVSTGANDLADVLRSETSSYVFETRAPIWDEYGSPIQDEFGYQQTVVTELSTFNLQLDVLRPDPRASTISIENSGSIAFSGLHGIKASNPAGQSVTINNSGDITSTEDTASRAGIYVSVAEAFTGTYTPREQTAAGDFTYNAYGQLTGVNAPAEFTSSSESLAMEYDAGAISVHNSGNIDMGAVAMPSYGGLASAGIYTRGDGGTDIVNTGDITVGKWSSGIQTSSTARTSISNSGRIEIGNASSGIAFAPSAGSAGDYRLGGDVYILNTGDIRGGITKAEAELGEEVGVHGMLVVSLGSNNEYLAGYAHTNELHAAYNEQLGAEVYTLFDIPRTRLYDTAVVNRGNIELKDGGRGISIGPMAGDSTATNEGTIIVGDGTSLPQYNNNIPSAGIFQSNFAFNGLGSTTSINTQTGVIVTGDDSAGIANLNIGGDSTAINEGSITTGNGVSTLITSYAGETYDRLFHSHGIQSVSAAQTMGTTAFARNSGDITVGDLAIGTFVSGQGFSLLDPLAPTAINVNDGIISTGDNSSGMFTMGTIATSENSGTITTGSYDISAFQPHPTYTADEFAQLGYGVASAGLGIAEVINDGAITTGNGTVGASAHMFAPGYGVGALLTQSEGGVITTGDDATGAKIAGNYEAVLMNDGRISVGRDSVGVDMSAGSVTLRYGEQTATVIEGALVASNGGIIETGDASIGVRMIGIHEDVEYSGTVFVFDPSDPYSYSIVEVAGAADSLGASYLMNSGTIRVGASSTAVELTGGAIDEGAPQIFNAGTIAAGQSGSAAIRINTGNSFDSYVVNVGTIAGDVVFGDGNDTLTNTQFLNNAGVLISTGNILMNGSTIDFGGGENRFDNDRGVITVAGGDNVITGADVVFTAATINAVNDVIGSTLTIGGNVSGSFVFGTDLSSGGTDRLIVTGNVASGSAMSVMLNPIEQLSGEKSFTVVTVEGENDGNAPTIAGVAGRFADTLLDAQISFDEATGDANVNARFGMGHMATAAASATTMAQNWWFEAIGSFGKRNMQRLAGTKDSGPSVWVEGFHEEGTVEPQNSLQDTSFDQKLSALQVGAQWTQELAGGSFSFSPMYSYGDAMANLNANVSSARGDAVAYGVNADYRFNNGLYINATWQTMTMDVELATPGTFLRATGETQAKGDGFNVETGFAYQMKSGLTLAPQLQYASVDVELDDLASTDEVYRLSELGGKSSLLRAGLSVFRTFMTKNGSITPLAEASYVDAADGESVLRSNGVVFANDTAGSGYQAEFGIFGRYKAWDIAGRVGLTDLSATRRSLSTNVTVRYRW